MAAWGGGWIMVEEQDTWASRTRKHREAGYGRPVDRGVWAAKTVKRPQQQPAQPPVRQLLGAADAQTVHPATSRTAPAHQTTGLRERGNDTSRSTGHSGRQNAATRRNMRREERVTVQGPVKKHQPDGMSHGGLVMQHQSTPLALRLKGDGYPPPPRRDGHSCQLLLSVTNGPSTAVYPPAHRPSIRR